MAKRKGGHLASGPYTTGSRHACYSSPIPSPEFALHKWPIFTLRTSHITVTARPEYLKRVNILNSMKQKTFECRQEGTNWRDLYLKETLSGATLKKKKPHNAYRLASKVSATKLRGSTDTYRSEGTGRTSAELLRASLLVQSLSQVQLFVTSFSFTVRFTIRTWMFIRGKFLQTLLYSLKPPQVKTNTHLQAFWPKAPYVLYASCSRKP